MTEDNPKIKLNIPEIILDNAKTLKNNGFQAFLVGGSVRDSLIGREPKDWDIATDATPEQIVALYPKTVYENQFGTVTIINEETEDLKLKAVEITPFRIESDYSDNRHPDEVKFGKSLAEDLARRDFTINALAYNPFKEEIIDLYGGIKDIKDKVVRTVGEADERFTEDSLRLIRAIRFASELGFTCNIDTKKSITKNSKLLTHTSIERVRDEFTKTIMSPNPMAGLILSHGCGILQYILPELEKGIGLDQKGEHIYDVWEHSLRAVQYAAEREFPLHVRLSALFHDIGKVKTRRLSTKGGKQYTFYGHDVVGERVTKEIMARLRFPVKLTEVVLNLVRNHMFFSDPDKITLSAVRRIIVNVGSEYIWDLMNLRFCDRIGMGRPKEEPYRLRKYESMIEEALRAPTSVKMLKIDGQKVMSVIRETPGPKIGYILNALLEEALENPDLNNEKYLEERASALASLSEKELRKLAEKGIQKKSEVEEKELGKIRSKFKVK